MRPAPVPHSINVAFNVVDSVPILSRYGIATDHVKNCAGNGGKCFLVPCLRLGLRVVQRLNEKDEFTRVGVPTLCL